MNRRRRLNLLVMGEGGPTVVLAAGFLGVTLDWGLVQPALARRMRVVSFDTAGMGFSDPGPLPRTSTAIVEDLRAALSAANLKPPYVLVGHSAGGLRMHLFAARYPDEVAGLVMVDSVAADWEVRLGSPPSGGMVEERAILRRLLALARAGALTPQTPEYVERVGLPRPGLSPAMNDALHAMWTRVSYLRTAVSESNHLRAADAAEAEADMKPLGDLPMVVMTAARWKGASFLADEAAAAAWRKMHDDLARLSSRGQRVTVDCGHNIPVEAPRAVTAAVEEIVAVA